MSLATSGPGSRGPGAERPEERASAGASTPAKDKTRKRPLPDVPPAKARPVEPHPVEPHPVEPQPATTQNGHALNGSAADGAVQPDRLTVVNGRRPPFRRRVMRWGALILLALLLVVVGAFAGSTVAAAMPTLYAAHSDVVYPLVQQQPTGFLREDRNLSTQQVLIASREVLDPVAAKFKVSADNLDKHLTTEVVNDSEVIRLQFTDPSRAQARKVLAAVVDQYVKISNNPSRTAVRQYLDAQLADVQARLATARTQADSAGNLGLTQAAQAQVDALVTREATLLGQIDEEQFAAIAGPAPRIAVPAYVEHAAVSPKRLLVTAGGALAGLVVALIVVAVVARRMTRH